MYIYKGEKRPGGSLILGNISKLHVFHKNSYHLRAHVPGRPIDVGHLRAHNYRLSSDCDTSR